MSLKPLPFSSKFKLPAALLLLLTCCKTTQVTDAPKPPESYNQQQELPLTSTIAVPVNINMNDVLRTLNTALGSRALYEDYSYDDNGRDDLMMNAWKSQDISIYLSGNTLKYRVPLKIWAKKRLFVGEAEANAELALNFRTTFSINPDWSLSTQTVVEYHEWLATPVLKTGLGNLSVETLSNLLLNRSKGTLAQTLDRIVSQQLSLRPYVQEVWTGLQSPTLLSEEYKMWVKTTPTSIGMTPLQTIGNTLRATIAIECLNDVTFGEQPVFRANSNLPNLLQLNEAADDFQLRFATDVPFGEAERIAKGMMLGQVFESGKKKVKIEDLQLWGNNDKVVVNSRLSGSFNGNIYFIGRPVFNAQKNQIEVADLDFHADTRNFLYRSAAWIFQGPIRRQMAASMTFPLDENLSELKNSVQETLRHYEIQPGVILTGTVDSVQVQDTRVTPTGIRVDLFSKGRVSIDVQGL